MTQTRRYYYAVMRADDAHGLDASELDIAPVAGDPEDLAVTRLGGVALVHSDTELDEILSTRRNMLAHARALERMMAAGPILPFRFGVIAESNAGLETAVAEREKTLQEQLEQLVGRYEVGVRIAWNRAAVMKAIVDADAGLAAAYRAVEGRPERETHYDRIEIGRRAHAALGARLAEEQETIDATLAAHAFDARRLELNDDMSVLNAAYLADAEREQAMIEAVEAIDAAAPGLYQIKVLSPTPPFNFVAVDLGSAAGEAA